MCDWGSWWGSLSDAGLLSSLGPGADPQGLPKLGIIEYVHVYESGILGCLLRPKQRECAWATASLWFLWALEDGDWVCMSEATWGQCHIAEAQGDRCWEGMSPDLRTGILKKTGHS